MWPFKHVVYILFHVIAPPIRRSIWGVIIWTTIRTLLDGDPPWSRSYSISRNFIYTISLQLWCIEFWLLHLMLIMPLSLIPNHWPLSWHLPYSYNQMRLVLSSYAETSSCHSIPLHYSLSTLKNLLKSKT